MTRRWYAALGLAGLVAVAAVGLFVAATAVRPTAGLDPAAFAAVTNGMTRPQVDALFGGPPGDYSRKGPMAGFFGYTRSESGEAVLGAPAGAVRQDWYDNDNRYEVFFDAAGRVVFKYKRIHFSIR